MNKGQWTTMLGRGLRPGSTATWVCLLARKTAMVSATAFHLHRWASSDYQMTNPTHAMRSNCPNSTVIRSHDCDNLACDDIEEGRSARWKIIRGLIEGLRGEDEMKRRDRWGFW